MARKMLTKVMVITVTLVTEEMSEGLKQDSVKGGAINDHTLEGI